MNNSELLMNRLQQHRLIALLSPKTPEDCLRAYEALDPLGVTLEIAFRSDNALEGMKLIMERHPDALIMSGTTMTARQASNAIAAGVAGVVSADYIPEVVEVCARADVMCVPGGFNDAGKQLAQKASLYGCTLDELREQHSYQWVYKLFPVRTESQDNSGLTKAWRGPYKHLAVVYTGGVSLNNLPELAKIDPQGIFCGSALTKDIDNPKKMVAEAKRWIDALNPENSRTKSIPDTLNINDDEPPLVVTFGELMLRLSPPDFQRFVQADHFNVHFGGAEANTAVAFANYGLKSRFISALPSHEIGQAAVNSLRKFGVDTLGILRQGKRVGIYFLEYGASQRPSKVIYDRAGSSIAELKPGEIDWQSVFAGASWFHWSGITPALSNSAKEVTLEALKAARSQGVKISVDLNYRKKLWTPLEAQRIMTPLMEYVDVCIGNEEDAEKMFGIRADNTDVDKGKLDEDSYRLVANELIDRFGLAKAAITLRESVSASDNLWSACLANGRDFFLSRKYDVHLVDRVGGGDSFSSGLIYGFITGMTDREALEFGVAASCLKQTIPGDYNLVSVDEVKQIASGNTGGRVQR